MADAVMTALKNLELRKRRYKGALDEETLPDWCVAAEQGHDKARKAAAGSRCKLW